MENLNKDFNRTRTTPDQLLRASINIDGMEKRPVPGDRIVPNLLSDDEGVSAFREELKARLTPNLPAKELIGLIVRTALEVEFGKSFTSIGGFDKMVKKIADAMMLSSEMRRQALTVVSAILDEKLGEERKN